MQSQLASPSPSSPRSYGHRLPQLWEHKIEVADRSWIGKEVFRPKKDGRCVLAESLKLWNSPPPVPNPDQAALATPSPEQYFRRRLCLWMPRRLWHTHFVCPDCKADLTSKVSKPNHILYQQLFLPVTRVSSSTLCLSCSLVYIKGSFCVTFCQFFFVGCIQSGAASFGRERFLLPGR